MVLPKTISRNSPVLACLVALGSQVIHRLDRGEVGGNRTAGMDHLSQLLGVVQKRAGAERVIVDRLPLFVLLEQRAFEGIQKTGRVDVAVAVVDERTRFDIALCVDMHIAPAAGNATVDILTVVPEVHRKDGF